MGFWAMVSTPNTLLLQASRFRRVSHNFESTLLYNHWSVSLKPVHLTT